MPAGRRNCGRIGRGPSSGRRGGWRRAEWRNPSPNPSPKRGGGEDLAPASLRPSKFEFSPLPLWGRGRGGVSYSMTRPDMLARATARREPWDVVIIGGGATGAGIALDAATRGYSVLLLERHDFGKGTSSRSTKLVHGGVRYLAQGQVHLVWEALHERGLLLKNAPHVAHSLPFVVPAYRWWDKPFYGIGLTVYEFLAGNRRIGRA